MMPDVNGCAVGPMACLLARGWSLVVAKEFSRQVLRFACWGYFFKFEEKWVELLC